MRARKSKGTTALLGWLLLKAIVQRLTDFSTAREMRGDGTRERGDSQLSLSLESFCRDRLSLWYFSFFGGYTGRVEFFGSKRVADGELSRSSYSVARRDMPARNILRKLMGVEAERAAFGWSIFIICDI